MCIAEVLDKATANSAYSYGCYERKQKLNSSAKRYTVAKVIRIDINSADDTSLQYPKVNEAQGLLKELIVTKKKLYEKKACLEIAQFSLVPSKECPTNGILHLVLLA